MQIILNVAKEFIAECLSSNCQEISLHFLISLFLLGLIFCVFFSFVRVGKKSCLSIVMGLKLNLSFAQVIFPLLFISHPTLWENLPMQRR